MLFGVGHPSSLRLSMSSIIDIWLTGLCTK